MATKRRKKRTTNTRRRHNTRRTYNPRRHRAAKAAPRRRRRRHNPRRTYNPRRTANRHRNVRHHHRRRHNPSLGSLTGLLEKTVVALVGAGITTYAYTLIGPMVPLGGMLGQIGIKLGLAWGLGELAKRSGFAKHAEMLSIGGAISAGQDAMNYFIGGGGLFFPGSAPAPALKPGQALLSPDQTGDSSTPSMSEIVYAPAGYGQLGDIVYGPPGQYLYQ